MHRLLTALIAVLGLAGAASSASAATVVFRGKGVIEKLSAECGAAGPTKFAGRSERIFARNENITEWVFRPAGLGTNGASTYFTYQIPDVFITSFMLDNGSLNGTFKKVGASQIALDDPTPTLAYQARVRLLQQTPSTLANKTKFVFLRGQIRDVENITGCTLTFHAALSR